MEFYTQGSDTWIISASDSSTSIRASSCVPSYSYVIANPSSEEIKQIITIVLKCLLKNMDINVIEKELDKIDYSGISNVINALKNILDDKENNSKKSFDDLEDDIIKEIKVPTLQKKRSMVNL